MEKVNVTSAKYFIATEMGDTEPSGITATIDGITMSVPLDPANRHYAEIMRQVELGELTIAPAE